MNRINQDRSQEIMTGPNLTINYLISNHGPENSIFWDQSQKR